MKMCEKLTTKAIVVSAMLACVVAVVFALVDTASYRRALEAISEKSPGISGISANVQSDLTAYNSCASMRVESPTSNSIVYTKDGRACLIAGSKSVKTDIGALAFANAAAVWISQHPTDESVRQASLTAIAKGREVLAQNKPLVSDLPEALARGHDHSWLLSVVQGKMWRGTSTFDAIADQFDRVEFAVMQPERANENMQWRLRAYQTNP